MLRLDRLELEGFGPFADRQVLEFPEQPGVTVIYGENMRGKTSLLNAIRYAFFGTVIGRASRPRRLHTISNRERASQGNFGFEVALTFHFQDEEYELVRSFTPIVDNPTNDSDYVRDVMLRRGTSTLGPDERERAIHQIFPQEISRFFLFDGELLQEYEELIINEGEAATKISAAIERILGVPILKRGRAHLSHLSDEGDKAAAREASKHTETQALGNALQAATEQKAAHLREIERLEERLVDLLSQREDAEQLMKANERYASLLEARDKAVKRREEAGREERQRQIALQRAMADAWKGLLREPIRAARDGVQRQLSHEIEHLVAHLRREALDSGSCKVCKQKIHDEQRARLETEAETSLKPSTGSISATLANLANLNAFEDLDNSAEVKSMWADIVRLKLEQASLADQINDLQTALRDSDPELIRKTKATYAELSESIAATKRGIEEETEKVAQKDKAIANFNESLKKLAGADLKKFQDRANLLHEMTEIFRESVEVYKTELRSRVEQTASNLFREMTTEKQDYAGLAINEAYGLTIMHQDGRAEEARSAGAEHVVALALMGALQQNAPLRGPIVMDSPFGRLDEGHTTNVVKTLPQMAEQTILLVYEAEVGQETMRNLLRANLLREYRLEGRSSRRTDIVRIQ